MEFARIEPSVFISLQAFRMTLWYYIYIYWQTLETKLMETDDYDGDISPFIG